MNVDELNYSALRHFITAMEDEISELKSSPVNPALLNDEPVENVMRELEYYKKKVNDFRTKNLLGSNTRLKSIIPT